MTDETDKQTPAEPPFVTAAEKHGMTGPGGPADLQDRHNGLSRSPNLRPVPNSFAPAHANGEAVPHVYGAQQAAVDPIAAGLDYKHDIPTRTEMRVTTRTGELGAGPRPTTYVEKGQDVPQSTPADGAEVVAPSDEESEAVPGPTSAPPEAPDAEDDVEADEDTDHTA